MAIYLECINLVVPIDVLCRCEAVGGFDGYLAEYAKFVGRVVWYDEHLCRASGSMSGADSQAMRELWERRGLLGPVEEGGELVWRDYCVVDVFDGVRGRCPWLKVDLESGYAWHADHPPGQAVGPFRPKRSPRS